MSSNAMMIQTRMDDSVYLVGVGGLVLVCVGLLLLELLLELLLALPLHLLRPAQIKQTETPSIPIGEMVKLDGV